MNTSTIDTSAVARRNRASFSPQQIQQHLGALQSRGLSAAAYARQEGLSYTTLLQWLRLEKTGRSDSRVKFRTVPISSLLSSAWAAEVVGPNGVTVRLSAQVPPALVTQLLALTARPC